MCRDLEAESHEIQRVSVPLILQFALANFRTGTLEQPAFIRTRAAPTLWNRSNYLRSIESNQAQLDLVSCFRSLDDLGLVVSGFECAQAEALDGCEDIISRFGPTEGSWIGIDGVDVAEDGGFELSGGAMDAAAQLLDEERVAGELEGLAAVRLQPEGLPDVVDRRGRRRPPPSTSSG